MSNKSIIKNCFVLLVLAWFCYSCSKSNGEVISARKPTVLEPISIENIVIPCDTLPSVFDRSDVIEYKGNLCYVGLNANSLYFFDLASKVFLKEIKKLTKGPQALLISDFYYLNEDSIFLFSEDQNKLQIINMVGEVTYEKDLNPLIEKNANIGWIESAEGKRVVYVASQKNLVFPTFPDYEYTDPRFYQYGFLANYSLEDEQIKEVWGAFPNGYGSDHRTYFPLGMNFNYTVGPPHILSFLNAHLIYEWNDSNKKLDPILNWKSNYLPAEFKRLKVSHDFQDELNYMNTEGFYFKTIADLKNRMLYRIVKIGQPLKNEEGRLNQYEQSDWSVIYGPMETNSDAVTEVFFSGATYRFVEIHLIKHKTLLVSMENAFNPLNQEDVLEFALLTLK